MSYNYSTTTTNNDAWTVRENAIAKMNRSGIKGLTDEELVCLSIIDRPSLFSSLAVDSVLDAFNRSTSNEELVNELSSVSDISGEKIIEILALSEFLRRRQSNLKRVLMNPADVYQVIRHHFSEDQERFIVGGVNGASEVMYSKVITIGLVNQTLVHPREVFADAVTSRCTGIFVAHNHPSRHVSPSAEDVAVTMRIKEAGDILGIRLLDHLVFSDESYYSFREHGAL